jgi:K+-sensing histidine kinase KdpD
MNWFRHHRAGVRLIAALAPLGASAALYGVVAFVPNSAAALILVLLVVGAASTGDRLGGLLAAVSAAIGFDFFLTVPYLQLRIDSVEDIMLAGLLLIVGLAVSELASWGIRQSAIANQQAGFVKGALESADLAAGSNDSVEGLERVAGSVRELLGAERVTFEYGNHDSTAAVINRDGTLRFNGRTVSAELAGLPSGPYVYSAIPVVQHGGQVGYFRIANPTQQVRPSRDQLRVAVLLAGEWSVRAAPTQRSRRDPITTVRSRGR